MHQSPQFVVVDVSSVGYSYFYQVLGLVFLCFFLLQVDNCKSKYDANNRNGKSFHCFKRYIAEPYFEKYDSLVDSYFQDFLAREVPLGLCEVLQDIIKPAPRLSILHRYLIGEGSHRRLSTSIQFDIHQDSISELPDHYCEAIIIEKLPSGVFADPFELQDLLQRGGNYYQILQHIGYSYPFSRLCLKHLLHSFYRSICFWRHKSRVAFYSVKPVPCWDSHGYWFKCIIRKEEWARNQHWTSVTCTLSGMWIRSFWCPSPLPPSIINKWTN